MTGIIFGLAALGLAELPPSGAFLAKSWIDQSASSRSLSWIIVVLALCSILVGGALLRVTGGVFYGLGDPPSEVPQMAAAASEETSETDAAKRRTPLSMIVPAALLVAAAFTMFLWPHLGAVMEAAAVRFEDQPGYTATVLSGTHLTHPAALLPAQPATVTSVDVLTGLLTVLGAVLVAFVSLYWRRLPALRRRPKESAGLARPISWLQSGVINDYVTWIVVGVACLAGALALTIR